MEGKKDQIVRPDEVKLDAKIEKEKEKAEIFGIPFAFPDLTVKEHTNKGKNQKKVKQLEGYVKAINSLIKEAEKRGEEINAEKVKEIIRGFLESRNAKAVSRLLDKAVKESESDEELGIKKEVVKAGEAKGQKEVKVEVETPELEEEEDKSIETKEDDIANKVNKLIENIKIKLGAAQVSGIISEEKLEKFNNIFDDKIDELNGILKSEGNSNDSEAKLSEFYKDLLKLKDTFFRQPKKVEDEQRERIKVKEEEKEKGEKEPDTESKVEEVDEAEKEFVRKAAEITLSKIEKWEELNADTEKKGDEKFKQKSRELWKNFVVHGRVRFDEKIQEPVVEGPTDLDGKVSIKLLNMAGFNVDEKNVEYVAPGGRSKEPGKFHLDTGNKNGIVILEDGTVFIDHHGPESDSSVSTTEFVYKALTGLGLLEKEKHLDDMVKFVTQVDNFKYPNEKEYFKNYFQNSWKTLLGLYRMSSMDNLLKFFQHKKHSTGEGLSPAEPLTPGLLKKFKFIYTRGKKEFNKSESHKEKVKNSLEELQKMKKEGFIINSDAYGKIAINIGGKIPTGIDGAKAFGCDTYISWNSDKNSFFISSLRGEALRDEFSQGINIRKTMWIKPMNEGGPLTVELEKVLEKMTDYKFKPEGELKKYLEKEKQIKQEKEFTAEDEKVMDVFVEYAKKFREKLEAEADWAGYSDEQKNDTLRIQTAVSIRLKMNKKNLFEGKENEVIEMILESKM